MRTFLVFVAIFSTLGLAAPKPAEAQMAQLEKSLDRMRARLDKKLFDGKTLNVTNWKEMMVVESFARTYQGHLQAGIKAWKSLTTGKTKDRLAKLQEAQAYFKGLYPLYAAKRKTMKKPVAAAKPVIKKAGFAEVVTGPNAAATKPALIDFYGGQETQIQVWGSPGSSNNPSVWSIRLNFAVKYDGFAAADVVNVQIYKGSKKRGAPIVCKPTILKPWPVALFECRSEFRDRKKMHKTDGAHSVRLSYKNLVQGKTFKDFATIRFNVLKLWGGSTTKPSPMWRTNRDIHLGPTTIEELNSNTGGYRSRSSFIAEFQKTALSAMDGTRSRQLVLRTWIKREKYFQTQATCLYKGKPIGWGAANAGNAIDFDVSGRKSKKKRGDYKARWDQLEFDLKGLKIVGEDGSRAGWSKPPHWLDQNPGDYKCVITGNGKVIKEVYFTVGSDGHVVKPDCQDKVLTTFKTVKLVKAKNKKWGEMKWKNGGLSFGGGVKWKKSCP